MKTNTRNVFVGVILMIVMLLGISMLTACNDVTLDKLQNEYGIVIDGGGFEEGSTLVSNEIATDAEEGAEVLAAIADQNYNKDGSVYIFDIYVTKDGAKVQPSGKVKVSVPLPNIQVDNYLVFHVKADNSVENLVPTVADGKISFETSSFSYFIIAEAAPAEHVHNYVWVELIEPTCEQEGTEGHYHCESCGKNFNPNYVEVESVVIDKLPHDVEGNYSPRVEPTFFMEGTVAYYICNDCLNYISEDGQVIPPEDIFIPNLSLDISVYVNNVPTKLVLQGEFDGATAEWKVEGLSVKVGDVITVRLTDDPNYILTFTCDGIINENGVVTTACESATVDFYADQSGMRLVMLDPTVCVHNYVWVDGTISTCTEEGIAPHYHCEGCGKNFDENYGEIDSVALPTASHEYGSMYWGKSANFWEDGNIEYYQCETCEKYFDAEYNEVESVVIPKYSTNLSICVNGTPTALVIGEQRDNFIQWSLEGLSVTKGDVITLCQTDNTEISHNYFASGNVDEDRKILTTAGMANVSLEATPNGLMLFIDGYKYEGIVIEINGVQYPMNFVTYPDGEETSYVYGYVNFAVGDEFVIVDNVSGTVYDYDDLDAGFAWDTWDFHRGENGEFVIDYAARYGIEFDNNGNKKIYITKAFAPYDGESFGMVFEGEREDVIFDSLDLSDSDSLYSEFMWTLNHATTMNNSDILQYINENGLWFYYTMIDLEAGAKFSLKNFTTGELIGVDHLVDITGDITAVMRKGDLVSVEKSGSFYIIYLPAFNLFTIECDTSDPLAEILLSAGDKTITLTPDENGDVFYEGFASKTHHIITIFNSKFASLPIILDESMDETLVDLTNSDGTYYAYPTKDGIYNLRYNVHTNVLYLEYVGGDDDQGGGTEGNPTVDYLYYLSVSGGSGGTQTLTMQVNSSNSKEVCYKGVELTASCFIGVIEMAKDASSNTTYGALATDVDSSIAQSYGRIIHDVRKLLEKEYKFFCRPIGSQTRRCIVQDKNGKYDLDYQIVLTQNSKGDLDPTSIKKRFLWAFTSVKNKNEKVEDSTTVITVRCSKDGCEFNVETEKFSFDFVIINPDETCRIRRNGESQYTWVQLPMKHSDIYNRYKAMSFEQQKDLLENYLLPKIVKEKQKDESQRRATINIFLEEVNNYLRRRERL